MREDHIFPEEGELLAGLPAFSQGNEGMDKERHKVYAFLVHTFPLRTGIDCGAPRPCQPYFIGIPHFEQARMQYIY
jgi:hypothetical protein